MSVFGSKLGFKEGLYIVPETLGQVYKEIESEFPKLKFVKPHPGQTLIKRVHPVNEMDGPAFRQLPQEIIITQPPRLYRSTAWKYNGEFHSECECIWEVEFSYQWNGETRYSWMALRILLFAYKPVLKQLSLF